MFGQERPRFQEEPFANHQQEAKRGAKRYMLINADTLEYQRENDRIFGQSQRASGEAATMEMPFRRKIRVARDMRRATHCRAGINRGGVAYTSLLSGNFFIMNCQGLHVRVKAVSRPLPLQLLCKHHRCEQEAIEMPQNMDFGLGAGKAVDVNHASVTRCQRATIGPENFAG